MWFDSHCHLYDLGDASAIAAALERARAKAVTDVLVPGVDLDSSEHAVALASEHGLWAAAGIHPSEASGWEPAQLEPIEGLLGHPRVIAVGETGLDFYREWSPRDLQEKNFAAHIELARKHSKALIVHTRESAGAALDMLERYRAPERIVFHCWSGDRAELSRALALGAFISFAGNITFKNADDLREALRAVPPDRLLIETDAPYLTPVPHRGTPNEPAHVALVGEAAAQARGEPSEEVAAGTSANARRAFDVARR